MGSRQAISRGHSRCRRIRCHRIFRSWPAQDWYRRSASAAPLSIAPISRASRMSCCSCSGIVATGGPKYARRWWKASLLAVRPSKRGALMQSFDLKRRLVAEALGTGLLVATVVGSGIMAESLTGDVALALLGNTLPTGAILVVLISIFGPISGAHFNPAVSLIFALKRDLTPRDAALYVAAQLAGGIIGTIIAHAMFALPLLDASLKARTGGAQWLAEGVAAFVLVATILAGIRFERASVPWIVRLCITAAYWLT